ncbi:MAG TPA: prepilin-type N-terminal cleavage/methylation domain-containing protein [Candidatus Absconditabacterales bacterium]|nr:prepilin-type N-terminal cleavage/methylation domain-containing protein [Candidatus Absconditabacterales bacterium]
MKRKSAFTFIEIMIAIVIFSIGILTVLKLVTDNLEQMDKNNVKVQATLLAKEGLELVYNLRDSNLAKELSWNCLISEDMYNWTLEDLNNEIGWGNQSDFEDIICDGYFGVDKNLQISFDPEIYVYYENSDKGEDFMENFEVNKLYFYEGDLFWYGYGNGELRVDNGEFKKTETLFARYLSFHEVREGENILPKDKILKVESHVLYMKGGLTGEVMFESFIGNY